MPELPQAIAAPLEVRNLKFSLGEGVPKHWHGGRKSVSIFFDNLSIFFPAGERFFIASTKAHRRFVRDPALLEDVAAFCAQEAIHGREHARYNEMLAERGYPARELERRVETLLGFVSRRVPKRMRLAATCALEHFTAMLAHVLLEDPGLLEGAHPTMAALWRWHAAEENEHKAVAFDVYRAAGGPYVERAGIMLVASAIFWAKVAEQQVRLMKAEGIAASPGEWKDLFVYLFVEPGGLLRLAPAYLDYFRPGFHPWDLDNRELLERWKRERAVAPAAEDA